MAIREKARKTPWSKIAKDMTKTMGFGSQRMERQKPSTIENPFFALFHLILQQADHLLRHRDIMAEIKTRQARIRTQFSYGTSCIQSTY